MTTLMQRRAGWQQWLKLAPGLVISAIFLALLLWNVDWDQFWSSLRGANYAWLMLSLLALTLAVILKVQRWQLLLLPAKRTSPTNVFYSISIGYLVNTVLPGRLGELARASLLARLESISVMTVLSTVAVDRILDLVVLALLLAIVLPMADLPDWVAKSGLLVGAGGLVLLFFCLFLAYPKGRDFFLRRLSSLPRFPGKPAVEKWADAVCLGVEGLKGAWPMARVLASSLVIWLVTVLMFYFGQLAFHLEAPLWAAILITTTTSMGMVVPSSPGYMGVFHYLVVLSMMAFGETKETSLGYAVVIHLTMTLSLGLMGVFSLWRCGLSLAGVHHLKQPPGAGS
ncbi:MAG: lysylphosphatidylglycerol synthase transmembrane domain-containing protein [Chloroflexota bacterium]|jgi:uncharacterized protein (TIRG00374 family)